MTTTSPMPRLLTIEEVAEILTTSTRHVRRLVAERRIPFLKVGHFIRLDAEEVASWLEGRRVQTEST